MRRLLLVLLVLAAASSPLHAQQNQQWRTHKEVGDVAFLAANSLLGGLSAGAIRELRGGSFRDGFAAGALGGAISYGGRRIATQEFTGAGFVGRQVAAVGGSLVRNSAALQPALSHIVFPLGPVLLDVRPRGGNTLNVRLDVATTGWLIAALAEERLDFLPRESLSAGAPVFRSPLHHLGGDRIAAGRAYRGLIVLGRDAAPREASVLAHERAHVLQIDFMRDMWTTAIEYETLRRMPGGPRVLRHAELNVTGALIQMLLVRSFGWSWEERPWEIEAEFLQNR
ncbi:MAG TPA: hypothetical protein VK928_02785 [Longimicrobiales bacterium]|nr:hypothetical protein [Longimicrobiales bacterium]